MKRPKLTRKTIIFLALAGLTLVGLVILNLWIILLCFVLGVASHSYRRWIKGLWFGNELTTIGAIVIGLLYGSIPGALFGAITALVMQFVAFDLDLGMVMQTAGSAAAGFLAPLVPLPPFAIVVIFQIVVSILPQLPSFMGDPAMRIEGYSVVATKTVFAIGMWNALYRLLL